MQAEERVESVSALAELVLNARATGTPLRIAGAGTWMDAGRPTSAEQLVSLRSLSGVLEYVPGDLTITALAGTTHAELDAVTAAEGQWVPLDPVGSAAGTVGATIATGSSGPLSALTGTPRDVVLGIDAVLGQGDVISAGGRVVKNVAGFDLVRLLTGSWGTLGILTAVTLRLRARPEMDVTMAVPIPDSAAELGVFLQRLSSLPISTAACELVSPAAASRMQLGDGSVALMRFMGSEASVNAQLSALSAGISGCVPCPDDIWANFSAGDEPGTFAVRWSAARAQLPHLWQAARSAELALGASWSHANVARGVVRQVAHAADTNSLIESWRNVSALEVPSQSPPPNVRFTSAHSQLSSSDRSRVVTIGERMPAAAWPVLCPSAVNDRLSVGVRDAFDPQRLLNRGILGDSAGDSDAVVAAATGGYGNA